MFVDQVSIELKAGDGGMAASAFVENALFPGEARMVVMVETEVTSRSWPKQVLIAWSRWPTVRPGKLGGARTAVVQTAAEKMGKA